MHGLPKDFDGTFFIGRTLEMVCFNENQVYLHFDAKLTITIESAFAYKDELLVKVPVHDSNLMELLGSSVLTWQGDKDGTLSLTFERGRTLKVYDTTKQYESYTISYEGKVIIV
jgi:hypothetical protein